MFSFEHSQANFFDIRATGNDRSSKHKFEACNICMDEIGTAENVVDSEDLVVPKGLVGRLG